ncbi:hypothetical protein CTEN210_13791 [Chaetoceros tenuissimus]|uniref:Cation efflux protein transmembrane domain-containing protein n=3 Tax=Chaetoceros tenuissimus TaxID=426638 RepID=A0AAD3D7A4_9STRA|nr:hypothetical protein CTEN210_13791 [Chaetoceros tenuissimus]
MAFSTDTDLDAHEENAARALELPETVSNFYDQQYKDAEKEIPRSFDLEEESGFSSSNNALQIGEDGFDDDQIETITLEYDMGISKETKLYSRWCRRCFNCLPCCRRSYEIAGDGLEDKPSNEELLSVAFISFLSFTIAQFIAAYFAKSQAMLGDSMAMFVDAGTYGFNLIAERMKNRAHDTIRTKIEGQHRKMKEDQGITEVNEIDEEVEQMELERKIDRAKRKLHLKLELIPPLISVFTLICVTSFILHESVGVLMLDAKRDEAFQSRPDVIVMFVFSSLNLVVDVVNMMFFKKGDHLFGFDTFEEDFHEVEQFNSSGLDRETQPHLDPRGRSNDSGDKENDDTVARSRSSSPTKSNKAKVRQKLSKNFKGILKESKHRKGGAYATLGSDSNDSEVYNDSVDDIEMSPSKNGVGIFTIDDEDGSNENDEHQTNKFTFEKESAELDSPESHANSLDDDMNQQLYDEYNSHKRKSNLNMCSAWTHVFADTVRSLAVLIAALLGEFVEGVSPEIADASAAVVVSSIILVALLPLLNGMVRICRELLLLRREEVFVNQHMTSKGSFA